MNYFKSHLPAWICLLITFNVFSQNTTEIKIDENALHPLSKVAQAVKDAKRSGAIFNNVKVLELGKQHTISNRSKTGYKIQALNIEPAELAEFIKDAPSHVALSVPKNERENIKLQLIKVNPFVEGFKAYTSSGQNIPVDYQRGIYYRGVVEGNEYNSLASISIFDNEVIGTFTYEGGNMIIQPSDSRSGELELFNDKDIPEEFKLNCFSDQLEKVQKPIQSRGTAGAGDCVRVYLECDYSLYQNKGGTTNTINWITSVFNSIATLYANESINIAISEIFVWTTADTYSKTSSVDALYQFKNARSSFNGDVAHLAALGGGNLGGVAWLDALCSDFNYAYSNISSGYATAPNYSWTVEVMTHEMGHNLGSNHTQWCGWTGGALDNCYTTEGGCAKGPAPTNGGTIMSYCHLTSYGINFNNGFGAQPGNKIRTQVAASSCLSSGCTGGDGCNSPSGLTISNITQTTASANWNMVSGATSFSFEYKPNSGSNWTIISTSTLNKNITGLTAGTLYNTRVKATCSSGSSAYSAIVNFTTPGDGVCNVPVNLAASNVSSTTATINWSPVSGASSYNFQYKLESGNTWSQVNVATNSVNLNGMNPGISYSVRVQTVCGSDQSAFSSTITFTTQLGYCTSKGLNTNYEWIKRVSLGTIDRTSVADGGYFNGTSLVAALDKGSTYTIGYQSGSKGTGSTLFWRIWIDFNNNSLFETEEQIVSTSSSSTSLLNSSFTIPAGASTAMVRMRVAMKYGGYPTSCLTFSYGEVEDYSINIKSAGEDPCDKPQEFVINNITQTTAKADWNSTTGANSYIFEFKKNSASDWTTVSVVTSNHDLQGLLPNTQYNARVKSICTSGTSDYSAITNFTTQSETCNVPTNLNASGITQTSAGISWNAVTGATSYKLEYKKNSESTWSVQATTATTISLVDLVPGTLYNVRVKSNCSSTGSDYSSIVNFTTGNESCIVPANLNVTEITAHSVKANWTISAGATSYRIEYKLNSASEWTVTNTTSTTLNLSGLNANSLYDIRIKSICSAGSSEYTVTVHFTTEAEESCGIPSNLSASGVSQTAFTISWNSISGATSYNVYYKSISIGTWTLINVQSPTINLTGMSPVTQYGVKVQAICGSGQSEYSTVLTVSTLSDYCVSKGNNTNYEWIKRVNIGSIDRISGKDAGYFNATSHSTNLIKGTNYTINYQAGSNGSSGTLYWRVWIDFNNNNSFNDAGEQIVSIASSSTSLLSSAFTVPAGASTANVRMRVAMKYGGFPTSCLTFTYGEVEDYTINLVNAGAMVGPAVENERIENLKLFPNPFTNVFNLEFLANKDQQVEIILRDQLGNMLLSKSLNALSGSNNFQIQSSEFLPATYLLQIKSANENFFRKISKLE
jgi:hypothetical protein